MRTWAQSKSPAFFKAWDVKLLYPSQKTWAEFGEEVRAYPEFADEVSLDEFMLLFEDQKLYGYIDDKRRASLEMLGNECIPPGVEMMMVGVYEGFGPVALGWCDVGGNGNREFVSMMGFEHWTVDEVWMLRQLLAGEEPTGLDEDSPRQAASRCAAAKEFFQEVLQGADAVDFSKTSVYHWLGRRGFERQSRATDAKTVRMMCPQQ